LGEPSPNGKLLSDPEIREAATELCEDELRENVRQLVTAFPGRFVSIDTMQRLEPFEKNPAALSMILKKPKIVSRLYSITCEACGSRHIDYAEKVKAERAVSESEGQCGLCGEQGLTVTETFSVTEPWVKALRQGLWLELLISDLASSRTDSVWTGQMVGRNEIDVLAVFASHTILFECKDTSFGQNDLYIAAAKAERANADVVIIVTTRDVHQNVLDDLAEIGKRGDREFRLVSKSTAKDLKDETTLILDQLSGDLLKNWFSSSSNPWASLLYRDFDVFSLQR
jgi:hypothetical protein